MFISKHYTYVSPLYAPLFELSAMPHDLDFPIFVKNIGVPEAAKRSMDELKANKASLPYSLTNKAAGETQENPEVRRSRSVPPEQFPDELIRLFDENVKQAWRHFSFCGQPLAGSIQYLIYSGEESGFFVPHFDQGISLNGNLWLNTPERDITLLYYLNDDYTGGELRFPNIWDKRKNQPFTYTPKAGDLIAFPPHEYYLHEVLPVTSGTRFVMTRWYRDSAWYKDFGQLSAIYIPELRELLDNKNWQYGHKSTPTGNNFYFDKQFVSVPRDGLDFSGEEQLAQFPVLSRLWTTLQNNKHCFGHKLVQCYANGMVYGTEADPHRDTNAMDHFMYTTLVYAVDSWQPDFGGATVFYDNANGKILTTVLPEPWKIIQFKGNMLHHALPIAKHCKQMRKTLMFKSIKLADVVPDNRPFWPFYTSQRPHYRDLFFKNSPEKLVNLPGCVPCQAQQQNAS